MLLKGGASVTNEEGNTQLILAAQRGHVSMVELLLGKGVSIEAMNERKCTPLHTVIVTVWWLPRWI